MTNTEKIEMIEQELREHDVKYYRHPHGLLVACQKCGKTALATDYESAGVLLDGNMVDAACEGAVKSKELAQRVMSQILIDSVRPTVGT